MVNITQLRVGNLITPTIQGSSYKPTFLTLEILNAWTRLGDLENWVASEITGEYLLKMGFTLTSNYHPEGEIYTVKHTNGLILEVCPAYHFIEVIYNHERIRIVDIKYLHQVQNIFHSLTGWELKVNL